MSLVARAIFVCAIILVGQLSLTSLDSFRKHVIACEGSQGINREKMKMEQNALRRNF
jgi:hypothetical protein